MIRYSFRVNTSSQYTVAKRTKYSFSWSLKVYLRLMGCHNSTTPAFTAHSASATRLRTPTRAKSSSR